MSPTLELLIAIVVLLGAATGTVHLLGHRDDSQHKARHKARVAYGASKFATPAQRASRPSQPEGGSGVPADLPWVPLIRIPRQSNADALGEAIRASQDSIKQFASIHTGEMVHSAFKDAHGIVWPKTQGMPRDTPIFTGDGCGRVLEVDKAIEGWAHETVSPPLSIQCGIEALKLLHSAIMRPQSSLSGYQFFVDRRPAAGSVEWQYLTEQFGALPIMCNFKMAPRDWTLSTVRAPDWHPSGVAA